MVGQDLEGSLTRVRSAGFMLLGFISRTLLVLCKSSSIVKKKKCFFKNKKSFGKIIFTPVKSGSLDIGPASVLFSIDPPK